MIYADKENLKTSVAVEVLRVREKEMKFYTRNLSMVGTHAALLAGFAFTIPSQHEFKEQYRGGIYKWSDEHARYMPMQTGGVVDSHLRGWPR